MSIKADKALQKAIEKCTLGGTRLTPKRQEILKIMLEAGGALSAYEVVERYNAVAGRSIQPMSAYRILDFLISENLVHKLNTANQYIACEHIACDHSHANSHFVICRSCQKVNEIYLDNDTVELLSRSIASVGYHLGASQLELKCLCDECKQAGAV